MGLLSAVNSAVNGLNVAQTGVDLISRNITNANNAEYTRKKVYTETYVANGVSSGVQIASIQRQVDFYLQTALRTQNSVTGKADAIAARLTDISAYYGSPGAGDDITSQLNDFFAAFTDLRDNASQPFARQSAIQNADFFATQLSNLSDNLYKEQAETNNQIISLINDVNSYIDDLYAINKAINDADTKAVSKNDLFDKRDALIYKVTELINISVSFKPDGQVVLDTGRSAILDEANHYHLSYPSTADKLFFQNNGTLPPINIELLDFAGKPTGDKFQVANGGKVGTINSLFTGGKLAGLLEVRDQKIPNLLAQLDEFTSRFVNEFNAIHNDGVGYPPPKSLTGARYITGPSTLQNWSGEFRVAVLQPDGSPIASPYLSENFTGLRPQTIDLDTLIGSGGVAGQVSTQDIIDEINRRFQPDTRVGYNGIANIQLAAISDSTPAIPTAATVNYDLDIDSVAANNKNFRIVSATSSDAAVTVSLPSTLTSGIVVNAGERLRTGSTNPIGITFGGARAAGPYTITLTVEIDGVQSDIQYQVNNNTTGIRNDRVVASGVASGPAVLEIPNNYTQPLIAEIVDANGTAVPPGTPGFLRVRSTNDSDRVVIDSLSSSENGETANTDTATRRGFSHYYETNNFFVTNRDKDGNEIIRNSALNLTVRSDILNDPGLVSTGQLIQSPNLASGNPNYTYTVSISNNGIAKKLADLQLQRQTFNAAGGLPEVSLTFSSYLSEHIGSMALATENAENNSKLQANISQGIKDKNDAVSGVNIDEELANLLGFQNAYQATTRIITVVNEMMESLIQAA